MKPAARMFDPTAHRGTVLLGDLTVLIGNLPAARKGDPHLCPMADPKPHVGGVVTQGSTTVYIGNARAARMGDVCGCNTAGISGKGVPPVVGPGAPKIEEKSGSTADPASEKGRGPYTEHVKEDKDKDGKYDSETYKASAGEKKKTHIDIPGFFNMTTTESGPTFEHTRTGDMVDPGEKTPGRGPSAGKVKNETWLGRKGTVINFFDGFYEWGYEANAGHAEAEIDAPYGGGAQGSVVDGKVYGRQDTTFLQAPWLYAYNYFTDSNLSTEIYAEAGAGLGELGGSVKPLYLINADGRYGVGISGALAEFIGFKGKFEWTIGEKKKSSKGIEGTGMGGIPNFIVGGYTTVLIGG